MHVQTPRPYTSILARGGIVILSAGFMLAPNCAGLCKGCGKAASTSSRGFEMPPTRGIHYGTPGATAGARLGDDALGVNAARGADKSGSAKALEEAGGTALDGIGVAIDSDFDEDNEGLVLIPRPANPLGTNRFVVGGAEVEIRPAPDDSLAPDIGYKAVTIRGKLEQRDVTRVLREHLLALRKCYGLALRRDTGLSGNVRLELSLDGDGTVTRSRAKAKKLGDKELLRCMADDAESWQFPRSADGRRVKLTMPLQLWSRR